MICILGYVFLALLVVGAGAWICDLISYLIKAKKAVDEVIEFRRKSYFNLRNRFIEIEERQDKQLKDYWKIAAEVRNKADKKPVKAKKKTKK